jgi:hypothetical protein
MRKARPNVWAGDGPGVLVSKIIAHGWILVHRHRNINRTLCFIPALSENKKAQRLNLSGNTLKDLSSRQAEQATSRIEVHNQNGSIASGRLEQRRKRTLHREKEADVTSGHLRSISWDDCALNPILRASRRNTPFRRRITGPAGDETDRTAASCPAGGCNGCETQMGQYETTKL